MVVEHAFVTTAEESEVFDRVNDLMLKMRFRIRDRSRDEKVYERGKPKPRNNSSIPDLPQSVAVRFDRGRVNIATSIMPFRKPHDLHRQFLIKLATMIETQVTTFDEGERNREVSQQVNELRAIQSASANLVAKRKKKNCAVVLGLILFVVALFAFIIFLASQ